MKKNLIIFGSSGHAEEIFQCIDKDKYNFLGFVKKKNDVNKKKIYCSDDDVIKLSKKNLFGIVGVYDIKTRKNIIKKILSIQPKFNFISVLSKNSIVAKNSKVGKNVFIANGVIINSNSNIGDHTVINTGSIIEHDCKINSFVNVSPNSTILGNVEILDEVFIGSGSIIQQNTKINSKNTIGANSFVNKNIRLKNRVYFGNPVKVCKK